jgi:hypothetical protein
MVRCRPGTDAKLHVERRASARCQLPQIVRQRIDELVETGEADVGLVLHAATVDHTRAARRGQLRRCNEQRRLADTGSPASDTVAPSTATSPRKAEMAAPSRSRPISWLDRPLTSTIVADHPNHAPREARDRW